jgi:hypothetical protein
MHWYNNLKPYSIEQQQRETIPIRKTGIIRKTAVTRKIVAMRYKVAMRRTMTTRQINDGKNNKEKEEYRDDAKESGIMVIVEDVGGRSVSLSS